MQGLVEFSQDRRRGRRSWAVAAAGSEQGVSRLRNLLGDQRIPRSLWIPLHGRWKSRRRLPVCCRGGRRVKEIGERLICEPLELVRLNLSFSFRGGHLKVPLFPLRGLVGEIPSLRSWEVGVGV